MPIMGSNAPNWATALSNVGPALMAYGAPSVGRPGNLGAHLGPAMQNAQRQIMAQRAYEDRKTMMDLQRRQAEFQLGQAQEKKQRQALVRRMFSTQPGTTAGGLGNVPNQDEPGGGLMGSVPAAMQPYITGLLETDPSAALTAGLSHEAAKLKAGEDPFGSGTTGKMWQHYQAGPGHPNYKAAVAYLSTGKWIQTPNGPVYVPPAVTPQGNLINEPVGGGGATTPLKPSSPLPEQYVPRPMPDQATPAERAVDQKFAGEYQKFVTGGFADMEKNIRQLEIQHGKLLKKDADLTGPITGRVADSLVGAIVNPEAVDVREQIEEVVQRNLRVILGAQFTEKEGDRLIARAYNPNLEEGVNAERVGRLIESLKAAYEAKKRAAGYYEKNGTLKGFKGKYQFSFSDLERMSGLEPSSPRKPPPPPAGFSVVK